MYLRYCDSTLSSLNLISKFQTQFIYVCYIDMAHKYFVQYSLNYARKSRATLSICTFVPRPPRCLRPNKVFVSCAPRTFSSIQILKLASQLYSIISLKCTMPKGRVLIPVNADRCLHAKPSSREGYKPRIKRSQWDRIQINPLCQMFRNSFSTHGVLELRILFLAQ